MLTYEARLKESKKIVDGIERSRRCLFSLFEAIMRESRPQLICRVNYRRGN